MSSFTNVTFMMANRSQVIKELVLVAKKGFQLWIIFAKGHDGYYYLRSQHEALAGVTRLSNIPCTWRLPVWFLVRHMAGLWAQSSVGDSQLMLCCHILSLSLSFSPSPLSPSPSFPFLLNQFKNLKKSQHENKDMKVAYCHFDTSLCLLNINHVLTNSI